MEINPLVSVIIPCYNQGKYIAETLDSVLNQTYKNWEAIIINDGSTDNSAEIAGQYTKKDNRIILINTPNGGLSAARNNGLKAANGQYILPLDSDDIIAPTYIEKAVSIFKKQENVKLIYCKWSYFGKTTKTPPIQYNGYKSLLLGNQIFCSALFRKDDALAIGGYDENMRTGYEDWEFFIRLLDEDSIVVQIQEPLFYYRIKDVSLRTEAESKVKAIEQYIYTKNLDTYTRMFSNQIDALRHFERFKNSDRNQFHIAVHKLKQVKGTKKAHAIVKEFASICRKKKYVVRLYLKYLGMLVSSAF